MAKKPILVYVQGGYPAIQAIAERAVAMWNQAVGATVLKLVPDGTEGAVPIRVANERNDFYSGMNTLIDEEAEYTGLGKSGEDVRDYGNEVHGTKRAFMNEQDLTLAHELGHALGLYHPFPTSTQEHYVPATEQRVERFLPKPIAWRVAPVGIMGNDMSLKSPNYRGLGPSAGEVAWVRREFNVTPPAGKGVSQSGPPPHRMAPAKKRTLPDPRQR